MVLYIIHRLIGSKINIIII